MTTLPDLEPAGLNDLLPCPFCNGRPYLDTDGDEFWVKCDQCCVETRICRHEDDAFAAWNRRAARSVPEAGKAVDALAHELGRAYWAAHHDHLDSRVADAMAEAAIAFCASVPAPSGARSRSLRDQLALEHHGVEPQQAAPAEDVAKIKAALLKLSKVGFGYDLNPHDKQALKQAAAALTSLSAELEKTKRARYANAEHARLSDARANLERAEAAERKLEEHRKALEHVRAIISEGAMVGFNPLDGTWAERLYASQGMTYTVLNPARGASE